MTNPTAVRVRFAPSPTGAPHLGNLRTALFNWCLARATGGAFILRIEDTDQTRLDPDAERRMKEALDWLGLYRDEGPDVGGPHAPYHQSKRAAAYREAAERLVAAGHAYYCDCTPERLDRMREAQTQRGQVPRYDRACRDRNLAPGPGTVIRLRVPETGTTLVTDAVHDTVKFENRLLDDIILMKSDGFPTYHLANVVDDHAMQITHVLRADEWLPSTPMHVLMYRAFGWEPPLWAHLPLITDARGRKLRKRAPQQQVSTYIEAGYLPEAMFNYLALLGWHPGGTDEVMTPTQIIARFSLARISRGHAAFDADRLLWFNRQHMARLTSAELAARAMPWLRAAYPDAEGLHDVAWMATLLGAVRDNVATLSDAPAAVRFALESDGAVTLTPEAEQALGDAAAPVVLRAFVDTLPGDAPIAKTAARDLFSALRTRFKEEHGWGGRKVMFPLRAALTGHVHGPRMDDVVVVLGAARCRARALAQLERMA